MKKYELNFNDVKLGFCFERIVRLSLLSLVLFSLVGCATKTANIDMHNDQGQAVMGLDYRDFQKAAGEAVSSMLQSGAVNKRGGGVMF